MNIYICIYIYIYICISADPFSVERVGHPLAPCIDTKPKHGSKTAALAQEQGCQGRQGSKGKQDSKAARQGRKPARQLIHRYKIQGRQDSRAARRQGRKPARQQGS